ncbi:response regulator transcription factor [Vallitalea okinawensis]|uniref:response regulator transcription factor n=1 Tax=Vallitalea okinawensis TaxID=2078660 RepID=UPI001478EB32|nr:response regulator transcription factor [Vallitalea okinawensis]
MAHSILLAEDDQDLSYILKSYLQKSGYLVDVVKDGAEVIPIFKKNYYDIILLDINLPHVSGYEICKQVRDTSKVPIIIISCNDKIDQRLEGFELGADDYMIKPIDYRELICRIKARLNSSARRSKNNRQLNFEGMIIDIEKRQVRVQDKLIKLTQIEFNILKLLALNSQKTFSFDELHQYLWQEDRLPTDRALAVHISNLRKKIQIKGMPSYVITVRGVGYKFNEHLAR